MSDWRCDFCRKDFAPTEQLALVKLDVIHRLQKAGALPRRARHPSGPAPSSFALGGEPRWRVCSPCLQLALGKAQGQEVSARKRWWPFGR